MATENPNCILLCELTKWKSYSQYALASGKYRSNSTRAGIVALYNKTWLLRLDKPHTAIATVNPKFVRLCELSKAVVVNKWLSYGQYALASGKYLSTSTRAGIVDLYNKTWLLRLDKPHKGMNKYHINFNYKLTGFRDPHTAVPAAVVKGGEVITKTCETIAIASMVTAVVVDAYNIFNAAKEDIKEKNMIGKHTAKAGMSATGGWVGSYVGSSTGGVAGTYAGWIVGGLLGVGAVPGAAVGCLCLSVVGGIGGFIYGRAVGADLVEQWSPTAEEHDVES